jgi:hypothetical protein
MGGTMIQFGEWLPDQPDYQNAGVVTATNVVPAANGYTSLRDFVAYSTDATDTIKGIYAGKSDTGDVKLFAGDSGRLYEFNSTDSGLDDISDTGGYSLNDSERWRFVQFGNQVIAAGGIGEELQEFTLGTSTDFAVLSTDAPKADFICVVRDFVWTGNIDEGSGRKPYRVYWSGFNDTTSWTSGTDQSDFQDIPDAGEIRGLVGGEYCTILMERAIVRATYSGLPLVFQFDKVETARGCSVSGSVCNVGHNVFYLSDDGFYMFNGQSSQPIGAEKVNRFFFDDADASHYDKMTATVDPEAQLAVWSYVSNSAQDESPDRLLIYNYALNRWSIANVKADLVAPFFTSAYTLEQLDQIASSLDDLPASMDSPLYKGGAYLFGGARGKKIFTFTGDPLDGTIETGETGLATGNHTIVTRAYPYHRGGTVTVEVGTRNLHSDAVSFTTPTAPNDDGFAPFRKQGRYHRARFNISGNWEFAQGMDIEARKVGRR